VRGITEPRSLRPTLGREGWCQRLLTELIVEGPYPPYNSPRRPSDRGVQFLGGLDALSFGTDGVSGRAPVFVDEIDLPARHPEEQGCAPDYTVFVEGRCWVIELKTEPASHRPRQIPDYFERARHYHPDHQIDITYLTAGLPQLFEPATEHWARYTHIEWAQVIGLLKLVWSTADIELVEVADLLVRGLEHLADPIADWWSELGYEVPNTPTPQSPRGQRSVRPDASEEQPRLAELKEGLSLAEATGTDGRQRALGLWSGGLQVLQEQRLLLHRACRGASDGSPLARVQPWLWSAPTSGGTALTDAGTATGYELRFSRSRAKPSRPA
jgi:hypothetical protein